ncbi:MAG TPA: PhzF family phenazine biosynthesis isomerase, partial [Lysobacter sp.]|nr:PhzF family phenazine biosynthesis isomerase [Lysobacter sp.]
AFTTRRYEGNPAGVVANAAGLEDTQMQLIARELNNSETAFILPAEGPDHDVRVRFFTPTTEVPVCGHATVSAHYVLALEDGGAGVRRQLTGAGVQRIETAAVDGDYRIAIQQNPPVFHPPLPEALASEVAAALGIGVDALDPRCPLQFVSTGHGKLLVGVRDRATLQALQPDAQRLVALGPRVDSRGFFVFTLDTPPEDEAYTWGRMFAPAIGVGEDPVTGNANGPLGAYLVKHRLIGVRDGQTRYRARQAAGSGRGGWMDVQVRTEKGEPVAVQIEGRAVVCFRTTLPRD